MIQCIHQIVDSVKSIWYTYLFGITCGIHLALVWPLIGTWSTPDIWYLPVDKCFATIRHILVPPSTEPIRHLPFGTSQFAPVRHLPFGTSQFSPVWHLLFGSSHLAGLSICIAFPACLTLCGRWIIALTAALYNVKFARGARIYQGITAH